jgi:hypothetical protein
MSAKPPEPKNKPSSKTPSTGRGAASALDVLVKRRVPAPSQQNQQLPQPEEPTRKKHGR